MPTNRTKIANRMRRRQGFTIVELLIVIVVVGILAAITIVAYTGIQGRARDAKRQSDMLAIQQGIELYYVDNGGYPTCGGVTYQPGAPLEGYAVSSCLSWLSPKYLSPALKDPQNSGSYQYWYAVGFRKTGEATYVADQSSNYITGAKLESKGGPYNNGWTGLNDLNYLGGSNY